MKKTTFFKSISIAVIIILLISCCTAVVTANTGVKPKNLIFLIGDGMGPNQVAMARQSKGSALHMDSLQYKGTLSTANIDGGVTDSAAAATAIACGVKTKNGRIGMDAFLNSAPNIREYFAEMGKKTGLVTTATATDATPAAFGAHIQNRSSQSIIAAQFIKNNIDVIMGGGAEYFNSDLIALAKEKGYSHITNKEQLSKTSSSKILGLFCEGGFPLYHNNGYTAQLPTLEQMAKKSIEILNRNENGFFLMVEGAAIDHAGHINKIDENITETLEFDKAVKVALDFAAQDKNTLVIVAADHETGGLKYNTTDKSYYFTTNAHTSANVPVSASGVGASRFTGDMSNIDLSGRIKQLFKTSAPNSSVADSSSLSASLSVPQSISQHSNDVLSSVKSSSKSTSIQQSYNSSIIIGEIESDVISYIESSVSTSVAPKTDNNGNGAKTTIFIIIGAVIVLSAGGFLIYKFILKK